MNGLVSPEDIHALVARLRALAAHNGQISPPTLRQAADTLEALAGTGEPAAVLARENGMTLRGVRNVLAAARTGGDAA